MFVLKHEREPLFQFAPLQGDTFKAHIPPKIAGNLPDSLVLLTENRQMLTQSDAAVHVMKTLSPGWARVGKMVGVLPKPLRDLGYRYVATVRKKVFKKPEGVCPLVPPELRGRFVF